MITTETRRESHELIQVEVGERHKQCIAGLEYLGQATANEIARYLYNTHIIPNDNTNFTNPRLNELRKAGLIEVVGKKKDLLSDRTVAIYSLVKEGNR